uniref:Uncharacterized protein n=1 Tax=Romanomermis culicivorax TaxID=13658 RepID=A0A915JD26_ROMCU
MHHENFDAWQENQDDNYDFKRKGNQFFERPIDLLTLEDPEQQKIVIKTIGINITRMKTAQSHALDLGDHVADAMVSAITLSSTMRKLSKAIPSLCIRLDVQIYVKHGNSYCFVSVIYSGQVMETRVVISLLMSYAQIHVAGAEHLHSNLQAFEHRDPVS